MNRIVALAVTSFALAAFAGKDGALTVSCDKCGAFQGIQVLIDGAEVSSVGPSVHVDHVSPGDHEVKIVKWKSPFATEQYWTGMVKFVPGIELRAKASKGNLEIYGRGPYTPPPPPAPVVTGPSEQQINTARESIADAQESLDDLQERVEDSDDDCSTKLLGRLGSLEDALHDAKKQTSRSQVDTAVQRASDARRIIDDRCESRSSKKWGKSIDRVIARLQNASQSL